MLCEWPMLIPERWETSVADTSSETKEYSFEEDTLESVRTLVCSLCGCPRVHSLKREYLIDIGSPTHSDSDITDLKQLYSATKSCKTCHIPDTQCPECNHVAVKAKDLYYHIHSLHPYSCTFACLDCDRNFQTDHAHQNHMNNQHRMKQFHCKSCLYKATMESQMLDHVHTHMSKKFECVSCNVKLATKLALQCHTLLHLSKDELRCEHCGKHYALKLALTIHVQGKHGDGYKCP